MDSPAVDVHTYIRTHTHTYARRVTMFVVVGEENGNEWQMRMQIQRDARQVAVSKYDVRF